jgi:hypothetical protein
MRAVFSNFSWPWAGLFGGAAFWYGAHELGLYFSGVNCRHQWIVPTVQLLFSVGAITSGLVSWNALSDRFNDGRENIRFSASVSAGAAALFALVILWQAIASFAYDGCAR